MRAYLANIKWQLDEVGPARALSVHAFLSNFSEQGSRDRGEAKRTSRRLVLTRSPERFGIIVGATTSQTLVYIPFAPVDERRRATLACSWYVRNDRNIATHSRTRLSGAYLVA
jgi:hypothetical protein